MDDYKFCVLQSSIFLATCFLTTDKWLTPFLISLVWFIIGFILFLLFLTRKKGKTEAHQEDD
jgi:phosphotransferase system  glucose/maltose/N-acetylglucosamine-specific IIC component